MDIHRNNYESWFMDYLDGKLSAGQKEILMSFLEFNPDLAAELRGMENTRLEPGGPGYDLKASLRKPSNQADRQLMEEDFEGFCISSIEQQLSGEEEAMLGELIDADSEKRNTYRLYQSSILEADKSIRYPGKSRLKRWFIHTPAFRFSVASAAAVAVLLLALPYLFRNSSEEINISKESIEEPVIIPEISKENNNPDIQIEESPPYLLADDVNAEAGKEPGEENPDPSPGELISVKPEIQEKILLARLEPLPAEKLDVPGLMQYVPTSNRLKTEGYRYVNIELLAQETPQQNEKKLSLWRLADAGIRQINKIADDEYSLDRSLDENGNTRRFRFETSSFGISAPLRNTDNPE